MDAVGARRARSLEHRVGVEVGRCGGGPAADLDGHVCIFNMLGARAGLAVHRDGVES